MLFAFQQPLLANPKTAVNDYNALQVQSEFRPIVNAQLFHKGILEFPLKYIISIAGPDRLNYRLATSFYNDMQVVFDFSSKNREGDEWVIPCSVKSADRAYVWQYDVLLAKDGSMTIRKPLIERHAGYDDQKIIRDLSTDQGTMRSIVESILSLCLTKKVVLAFDVGVGHIQSQKELSLFDTLLSLKKDPGLGKILNNLVIVKTTPDKFSTKLKSYIDGGAEIFVFARATERESLKDIEGSVRPTYVDTKGFPQDAYYPLPEIVAISLARVIEPGILHVVSGISERLNIQIIEEQNRALIFRLLRSALPISWQSFIQDCAARREILKSL